jgi:hypothetical protein
MDIVVSMVCMQLAHLCAQHVKSVKLTALAMGDDFAVRQKLAQ